MDIAADIQQCVRCKKEVQKLIYYDDDGWWCEDCAPKKRACENQSKGCNFEDFDKKCFKHERYFCHIEKWCEICGNANISEDSLLMHYISAHEKEIIAAGSAFRATNTNNWRYCLISTITGTALAWYKMKDSEFAISVYIPVASDRLSEFLCTITITRPETNDSLIFTPELNPFDNWLSDWCTEIENDVFPWTKEGLDVSVNITRK